MNLLANAIDALEETGNYTLNEATARKPKQLQIYIHTEATADHQVLIQIRDNAGGIPPDLQTRIFDPFYTTKPTGKGTGLGLATSYQIVTDLHGGELTLRSWPGQGTDFFVQIPIAQ